MTTPQLPGTSPERRRTVVHGSPVDTEPEFALYTPEFAADPHRVYEQMRRRFRSLVPVWLDRDVPATLVISHRTAVRILHDPDHFPSDPRVWEKTLPADHPLRPMLEWRPNALRNSGNDHVRYGDANRDSIAGVDLHAMHGVVERFAIDLINNFCGGDGTEPWGRADLLGQYIYPLVYKSLGYMLGFDDDTLDKVGRGMAAIFDASGDAEAGNDLLMGTLYQHVRRKQASTDDDITTRQIRHPSNLSEEEVVHQLVTLHGGGSEPEVHLISNTLLLMLTDDRFAGNLLDGSLSTRDALEEVSFTNPPLANYCATYPRQPVFIDDTWLPAHQPVLISMAACNADPAVRAPDLRGNRSHLAFSAGEHQCPARIPGLQIAEDAVDQLLDALPDMRLAVHPSELVWRPGPLHRALTELPVVFPTSPPLHV
ncbi:cytochrome P450 [Nocardia sp. BMG51109]|uniref:cytochrome P450 n=1 Tax=Nocardia sp. BMG51109 TaxID=1056816 RepID=UPI0004AD7EB8|nr:cytochrome P450 [Nocardia sp. BMG51109]